MPDLQTIAITGASRGIGAQTAIKLASPQRKLLLMARSVERLNHTRDAIHQNGGEALVLPVDLSTLEGARAASRQILNHAPRLDVLLLNAGTSNAKPFLETALDDIEYELRLNYLAPLAILRQCLPRMQAEGAGHVICVGSLASLMPFPGEATYTASKAALASLVRTLRIELKSSDIDFTMVLPGLTDTDMTADHQSLLPAMSPERVARAIVEAIDDRPAMVIPGLTNRIAARLFRTFPGLSDRLLELTGDLLVPSVDE